MENAKHVVICSLMSLFLILMGTIGYMMLEGWTFFDALYMTVITISTVGYREVHEISVYGRLFTIFLVFSGVGFVVYVAGAVMQFMLEGRIRSILGRRRLNNKIHRLKNHYIVCGYGRIGRVLCQNLTNRPNELVVIENSPELVPEMDSDGVLYIFGDATDETNLIQAGINKAKGLIAVLATDADNVFLILTAKQINPEIYIMSRASHEKAKAKVKSAGADRVESPYDIGAKSMAQRILRPTVTSFLDLAFARRRADIQMEEIPVGKSSVLVDQTLKDSGIRQKFNLIIIAIKKADGSMTFNPSFEARIKTGDTLIAVGKRGNLKKLQDIINT